MAVGDAIAVILGTATTNRQPAAGVVEQISAIVKSATTDAAAITDGSNPRSILTGSLVTGADSVDATAPEAHVYNMAFLSNNSVFIRKDGTTDRICFMGVQVDG